MQMTLFSRKNRASARKSHPASSQEAADKLNAVDAVTSQEQEVLEVLGQFNTPQTAKALGLYMACMETNISVPQCDRIVKIAGIPHRRLSALVADEKVIRYDDGSYEVKE